MTSGRIHRCFAQALDGVTVPTGAGQSVQISDVAVASLRPSADGGDAAFGLRISITMSAFGRSVPVILDVLGYAVGRDELTFNAFALEQPISADLDDRLGSILVSRALDRPH